MMRGHAMRVVGVMAVILGGVGGAWAFGLSYVLNMSSSEPPGLYRRVSGDPAVGRLIAYPIPAPAFAYTDRRMGFLRHTPVLKEVAAVGGARICEIGDTVFIDGVRRGRVLERDGLGSPLPQWRGCHTLGADELFMFSTRVTHSFDSRYYGPVKRGSVIGVYAPVITARSA